LSSNTPLSFCPLLTAIDVAKHVEPASACDTAVQQVVSAYADLRTSFAAYAAALSVREAARTAYDAAFDSYLQGVGTYTDVASEQTALARADADKQDAHANVFTAAAALAFATGTIRANRPGTEP
jgi:outer membrane protein